MGNTMITTEQFQQIQMDTNFISKSQIAMLCHHGLVEKMSEILFDYQKTMLNGDYLTLQNILARLHQVTTPEIDDDTLYRRVYGSIMMETDGVWATHDNIILASTNESEIPDNQEGGEEPFPCLKCQDCPMFFFNDSEGREIYKEHIRTEHPDSIDEGVCYTCILCDKTLPLNQLDDVDFGVLEWEHMLESHSYMGFQYYCFI